MIQDLYHTEHENRAITPPSTRKVTSLAIPILSCCSHAVQMKNVAEPKRSKQMFDPGLANQPSDQPDPELHNIREVSKACREKVPREKPSNVFGSTSRGSLFNKGEDFPKALREPYSESSAGVLSGKKLVGSEKNVESWCCVRSCRPKTPMLFPSRNKLAGKCRRVYNTFVRWTEALMA